MLKQLGINAQAAARILAITDTNSKNTALLAAAAALEAEEAAIIEANALDLEYGKQIKLSASLMDRLMLNSSRIKGIADAIREVVELNDPVGRLLSETERPNGLRIKKHCCSYRSYSCQYMKPVLMLHRTRQPSV